MKKRSRLIDVSDLVRQQTAARLLGVTRSAVNKRVRESRLPAVEVAGVRFVRLRDLPGLRRRRRPKLVDVGGLVRMNEARPPRGLKTEVNLLIKDWRVDYFEIDGVKFVRPVDVAKARRKRTGPESRARRFIAEKGLTELRFRSMIRCLGARERFILLHRSGFEEYMTWAEIAKRLKLPDIYRAQYIERKAVSELRSGMARRRGAL